LASGSTLVSTAVTYRAWVTTSSIERALEIMGEEKPALRGERAEMGEVRYGIGRRARLLVKYLAARLRQRSSFTTTPEKEARK
jgi:hypothetical protein